MLELNRKEYFQWNLNYMLYAKLWGKLTNSFSERIDVLKNLCPE